MGGKAGDFVLGPNFIDPLGRNYLLDEFLFS